MAQTQPETVAEEIARLTRKTRKSPAERQRLVELQIAWSQGEQEQRATERAREAVLVATDRKDHYVTHLLNSIGEQTSLIARRMRENADGIDRDMARAIANLDAGSDGWRQYVERVEWTLNEAVQTDTALRAVRAMASCSELLQAVAEKRQERAQTATETQS
jgi:hypothetical protein